MTEQAPQHVPAGFWVRLAATGIDAAMVYGCVRGAVAILAIAGWYVPFELVFVLAFWFYSVAAVGWAGRSVGKAACGLRVRAVSAPRMGIGRALLREVFGKLLSVAPLLLGFFWIAVGPGRRAWHDRIAGSAVNQALAAKPRARIVTLLVAAAYLGAGAPFGYELASLYLLVQRMAVPADVTPAFARRDPAALLDVSHVDASYRDQCAAWLDRHGREPLDYAVAKANEHQLLIFGESHERRRELVFLNELVPELYHKAGVRCVALEVCLAQDNRTIERLVTAPHYDTALALEVARRQPWGLWGWREYWDVLETAWRLNQNIPTGADKLRIIGLDRTMDMPSAAMMGFEDNPARNCPLWEKMRIFRVLRSLPRILTRDAFMAWQVEREILEKGQRGIVWIGRNHSVIHFPGIGPSVERLPRMGYILHSRHGEKVFQVRLHGADLPAALVDTGYEGPAPKLADWIESVMTIRADRPVGFDVGASPFAPLRDPGSLDFLFEARLVLSDVAAGYVFLTPWRELELCGWLEHYVSPSMYAANKPFYDAFVRRAGCRTGSAARTNTCFAELDE